MDESSLRLALPEIVVALAVSVWAFATDERPLLHEAHELGVGPRALIQGAVVAVVYAAVQLVREARDLAPPERLLVAAAVNLALAVVFVLPAWLETRARRWPGTPQRDLGTALALYVAGALVTFASVIVAGHAHAMLEHHSLRGALAVDESRVRALLSEPAARALVVSYGVVFIGPALARVHHARPRYALLAAFVAALASVMVQRLFVAVWPTDFLGFGTLLEGIADRAPLAIALGLGPAFADKLVRKIEKRLPGRHADRH
jgi:hypothetical protein